MKTSISARLPQFTIEQINMLKRFYQLVNRQNEEPEEIPSTSRILIICINYFWKHIFEEKTNTTLDIIQEQVLYEYNKTTG